MRRVLALLVCAAALELGWLALWPLSITLSHSPLFTATLLRDHPVLLAFGQHFPGWSESTLTEPLGSPIYIGPATLLAAVMLYLAAIYGTALLVLHRVSAPLRPAVIAIIISALVFQATLATLPGLFSQDVFSYIAYGRVAAVYELNPYIWPPSVLRDPVVDWVASGWRTYASPYGPVWVGVQWLLARVDGDLSFADQALVYRALANVLLLLNVALIWLLLRRVAPLKSASRVVSFAAVAWNPLLLFEISANAHNDVLMVTFSLLALLLFSASTRGLQATAMMSLGTLVKYLSGLGLLWLGFAAAARTHTWPRRTLRLGVLAAVSVAIAALLAAPWLELPDSLDPLVNETARVGYVNSLPDTLLVMLVNATGVDLDAARLIERVLIFGGFAVYLIWEIRQVWSGADRAGVARALARSSLIYVLVVSTSMQTWYFCLPLTIALGLGWRRRIAQLTLAYSSLALPALYLSYYLRELTPGWVFIAYALVPLTVLIPDAVKRQSAPPRHKYVFRAQAHHATIVE